MAMFNLSIECNNLNCVQSSSEDHVHWLFLALCKRGISQMDLAKSDTAILTSPDTLLSYLTQWMCQVIKRMFDCSSGDVPMVTKTLKIEHEPMLGSAELFKVIVKSFAFDRPCFVTCRKCSGCDKWSFHANQFWLIALILFIQVYWKNL